MFSPLRQPKAQASIDIFDVAIIGVYALCLPILCMKLLI